MILAIMGARRPVVRMGSDDGLPTRKRGVMLRPHNLLADASGSQSLLGLAGQ